MLLLLLLLLGWVLLLALLLQAWALLPGQTGARQAWCGVGGLGTPRRPVLLRVILGAAEEQGEFKVETSQSDGVPVPKQPEGDTTSPGSDWADGTVLSIEAGWSLGAGRLEWPASTDRGR